MMTTDEQQDLIDRVNQQIDDGDDVKHYDRVATLTALAGGETKDLSVILGPGRRDAALEFASLFNGITPSESDRTHAAYGYTWAERKVLAYGTGVQFMRDAYWELSSVVDGN